jgi:hypothetical protein
MTTIVLGILLGAAGLGVIGVTALLLVGPLRRPILAAVDRARLRRCVARQKRGDAHLAADDVNSALRQFAGAFCFIVPRADARLLGDIARLHTGLLSRFVTIGGDLPGDRVQLLALAKVERLLDQWSEAQRRAVRVPLNPTDGVELQRRRRLAQDAIQELAGELMHRRRQPYLH